MSPSVTPELTSDSAANSVANSVADLVAAPVSKLVADVVSETTATSPGIDYDVAICGAGPAGMALALLLCQRGMPAARIALIDARSLAQASEDPRSLALSWGSRQILDTIHAWPAIATPIEQIHVSRRGQFGRSLIDRSEHQLPALGYVTRYGAIVRALGAACQQAGLTMLRPVRVEQIEEDADHVRVLLGDGAPVVRAAIVVQAEGGLFSDQASRAQRRDYQQSAVIAQVRASRPIPGRAYERFTEQGPLALLPQDLGGAHGEYSLVWCLRPEEAARVQALDDVQFLAELGAAFGTRLGSFVHATPRLAFPLGLNADPRSTARTVAIGNAAQTLHPVAGQGLNLGLRDVMVLARVLAQGADPAHLAQFTALREQDRQTTVRVTDTMARIFASSSPTQALLGLSLTAIDLLPPARNMLAELLMYGRR